jgi:uncharacterized protein (TIGR03083 family)
MAVTTDGNPDGTAESRTWAELYRATVDRVVSLAEGLPSEDLARPVPATPDWTVRDVLGHLAGAPADALSGRMDGAPGPDWTGRHVGERADRPLEEVLAELRDSTEDVVASSQGSDRPALVWNAAVHHADLHEALGLGVPPEHLWRPVVETLKPSLGEHAAALSGVPDYELFRAFFSRRSRAQTAAWGTGLDQEALDGLGIFGPRHDDQPVPQRHGAQ